MPPDLNDTVARATPGDRRPSAPIEGPGGWGFSPSHAHATRLIFAAARSPTGLYARVPPVPGVPRWCRGVRIYANRPYMQGGVLPGTSSPAHRNGWSQPFHQIAIQSTRKPQRASNRNGAQRVLCVFADCILPELKLHAQHTVSSCDGWGACPGVDEQAPLSARH